MFSALRRSSVARFTMATAVAGSMGLAAAVGAETIKSEWSDVEVEVDGSLKDWAGSLTYMPEYDLTLGVRNDGDYLYIALVLDSPMLGTRAILNGLTLSFDPGGGKEKVLGVKFPLPARELDPKGLPEGVVEEGDPPREGSAPDEEHERRGGLFRDPERLRAHLDRASYELDLLDAEGKPRRLGTDEAAKTEGIFVALAEKHRTVHYEIKIPLEAGEGRNSAIGAELGKEIGFMIESPAMERRDPPRQRNRSWAGGDRGGGGRDGGMGGGGRGGYGEGPPDGGPRMNQPFELVTRIKTASGPKK